MDFFRFVKHRRMVAAFYIFADKPELSDASIVVKFSAAGWAMSTDGGKTWNSGWLVDGTMIASILNAIGINAKWINTGALTIKDPDGKIIFEVDVDKKSVYMNPDVLKNWRCCIIRQDKKNG